MGLKVSRFQGRMYLHKLADYLINFKLFITVKRMNLNYIVRV